MCVNYLDDRKKEKDNFFNITWRYYTANHTSCLSLRSKWLPTDTRSKVSDQSFLQGQGRVAKKNIKIKGTRNYYFKTIGYCSTTKFNLELSKTYEVLCNWPSSPSLTRFHSDFLVIFLISQHINELNSLIIFSTSTRLYFLNKILIFSILADRNLYHQ